MTKRQSLLSLATRQDQLIREMEALAKAMSLSTSHNLMVTTVQTRHVAQRLISLAMHADMVRDIEYVEPV